MAVRQKPATWFTVLAVLLVLWGAMGCFSFYGQHIMKPPMGDAWTRDFVARQPAWFAPVYAVAVGAQLLGSIRLLMRSRGAIWVYVVALVASVIQFGWIFLGTELIAAKGAAATVPFPAVIIAVCVFQLWLARLALRRGWIG